MARVFQIGTVSGASRPAVPPRRSDPRGRRRLGDRLAALVGRSSPSRPRSPPAGSRRASRGCARRARWRSSARCRAARRSRAFVRPSAISRATSNSRAVSGRHGSSTEPRPRPIRASSSARAEQRQAAERARPSPGRRRGARPPRRSGSSAAGTGRGRAGPRTTPRSGRARPSRGRPARAPLARPPVEPAGEADQALGVARARRRRSGPSRRGARGPASSQRSASSGRRAARQARVPVTTNGIEQGPLAGLDRDRQASSQRATARSGVAGQRGRPRRAPRAASG